MIAGEQGGLLILGKAGVVQPGPVCGAVVADEHSLLKHQVSRLS